MRCPLATVNSTTQIIRAVVEVEWRAQLQRVGTGEGVQAVVAVSQPRSDAVVVEAKQSLHPHPDAASAAFDDAHQVDRMIAGTR